MQRENTLIETKWTLKLDVKTGMGAQLGNRNQGMCQLPDGC